MIRPNPVLRAKVIAFARKQGICSICWSRKATSKYVTCEVCRERKKANKLRHKEASKSYDQKYYVKNHKHILVRRKLYKLKHNRVIDDIEKAVRLISKL